MTWRNVLQPSSHTPVQPLVTIGSPNRPCREVHPSTTEGSDEQPCCSPDRQRQRRLPRTGSDFLRESRSIAIEAVPQLLATYDATTSDTLGNEWVTKQLFKRGYDESDGAEVGRRYGAIRDRGRGQHKL